MARHGSQRAGIALPVGHELLWYEIRSVLGQGGFGITYLAHDNNLGRNVALKEYLPRSWADRGPDFEVVPLDDDHVKLYNKGLTGFMAEARTLAKFKHPNIVQVLMVFEQHDTAYIAMEYEQGGSLTELLKSKQFIPTEESLKQILMPIIDGLQNVHDMGFLHRDIKPSNIYLRDDRSPVLIDFGSSRQTGELNTSDVTILVTQGYTPAEQYSKGFGQQGPWTDIYSLAASIYYTITGNVVTDALQRNAAIQTSLPDPLKPLSVSDFPAYSPQFVAAINSALNVKPEDRPQSLSVWQAQFEIEYQSEEDDVTVLHPLPVELPGSDDDPTVLHTLADDLDHITEENTTGEEHLQSCSPASPPTTSLATPEQVSDTDTVMLDRSGAEPSTSETDSTENRGTDAERSIQPPPPQRQPSPEVTSTARQPASTTSKGQQHTDKQPNLTKQPATSKSGKPFAYAAAAVVTVAAIGIGVYTFFGKGDSRQRDAPAAMEETASSALPTPDEPITLSSPLETMRKEVRLLLSELTEATEKQTNNGDSTQTQAAIAIIGKKFITLARSPLIQSNEELADLVAEAMVKSSGVSKETQPLIETLVNAPSATEEETLKSLLIQDTLYTDIRKQQAFVFGMASASAETKRSLQEAPQFASLVHQFKQSIRRTIMDGRFQLAARMTEITLLLQPDDPELLEVSAHLSMKN